VATVNWARAWQPTTAGPATGIYKSSDGGLSWQLKKAGQATDLEVDPRDFQRQYAGLGEIKPPQPPPPGPRINGVYRSVDAGETWAPIAGPWDTAAGVVGRVELALSPSNPDVLYVGIQDATLTASGGVGGKLLGLWKTTNAWSAVPTWQPIPLGATDNGTGTFGYCGWNPWPVPRENPACYYNHVLSVDPTNPNHLIGTSKWAVSAEGYNHLLGFYESWDGGQTWPTAHSTVTATSTR